MTKAIAKSHAIARFSRDVSPICRCTCNTQLRHLRSSQRALHTSPSHSTYTPTQPTKPQSRPRWAETPPLMTAPYRLKPLPEGNEFPVNTDSKKLDEMYNRFLGEGGDTVLSEEVKWLAVTHKSFDHGRRGYNDRLSYIGKMIIELQTSLALIHGMTSFTAPSIPDPYERTPYQHIALEGLSTLTEEHKRKALEQNKFTQLGQSYGIQGVLRWKPRKASDLDASGIGLVTQQAIYAVIGGVAMQRGGQMANDLAKERVLRPMGLYQ